MLKMFHQTMLHRNSAVFMSCFQNNFGESFSCEWRRRRRGREKKRDLGFAKKIRHLLLLSLRRCRQFLAPQLLLLLSPLPPRTIFCPLFFLLSPPPPPPPRTRGRKNERPPLPIFCPFSQARERPKKKGGEGGDTEAARGTRRRRRRRPAGNSTYFDPEGNPASLASEPKELGLDILYRTDTRAATFGSGAKRFPFSCFSRGYISIVNLLPPHK